MNLLFVCSKNQWRSPTGERIYRDWPGVQTRSAGTSRRARRTVSVADLRWADWVLVMERKHQQRLRAQFREELRGCRVIVLGIEDHYRCLDPALIERFRAVVDPLLAEQAGD
ncbi:low molecular weight protein tyrosine phosphatase family protein [Actomonas aquatica]|uniref:Protein tyrosine phosphatase n=1 Tax=Actomonas aquatica TaxID=2866162 RepID=A0ABZ1C3W5_9BACT|nr:protein tyrosine phosphatase [Opitutus sp. WL0086]WRQ85943.1 protein tyrosine phosphatase [Opitutus sp. WL0086]